MGLAAPATGCRDAGPALVAACARRGTRIGGGGAGRLRQTVVRAPWPSANREQRGGREEGEDSPENRRAGTSASARSGSGEGDEKLCDSGVGI